MKTKNKLENILEVLNEFEDKYNPLKVYAELRKLGIAKPEASGLAEWYEQMFYNRAIDEYKRIKK